MDLAEVIAGAILVLWPLQYRRSIALVRARIERRGGDVAAFDQRVGRRSIRAGLLIAPLLGIAAVILGAIGQ